MWDKNGHIAVPVAEKHIERAMERNSSQGMTADAIKEAIPDARHVCVDVQSIRFTRKGLRAGP
jgi:hypothetical protein